MSGGAKVESIDAVRAFRAVLFKFQESATVALGDAESEVHRMLTWLEGEQQTYWSGQIRKRSELVERCKEAVRMKKIFKDSAGRSQSALDEEKALLKAQRALEEATHKLAATKQHARRLAKEYQNYKGGTQRFATAVSGEIPKAVATLDQLMGILDQYTSLESTIPSSETPMASSSAGGMGRPDGEVSQPAAAGEAENVVVTDLQGFPALAEPQVALVHADAESGYVLTEEGVEIKVKTEAPPATRFKIFDTIDAAIEYGNKKIATNPKLECIIFDHSQHLAKVVRTKSAV